MTVLITGASRGIGRAAAAVFGRAGYSVAINYYSSEDDARNLAAELRELGVNAAAFGGDVASYEQVQTMTSSVVAHFGQIDVIINNAAIAGQKLLWDISDDEWDRMFAVNVKGMFNVVKAAAPAMVNRGRGKIINLSSIWGIAGASCEVHYSASKAAVIGFTKSLAKELAPSGIQVNCVAPGVIDTEMNAPLGSDVLAILAEETPLGRLGTPLEIAELLLFLASDKADFITGQVISPNGGLLI